MSLRSLPLFAAVFSMGCVMWIRDPSAYREELVELVEVRDEAIASCYDDLLARTQEDAETVERAAQGPYADIGPAVEARMAHLQGDVVVQLVAGAETGAITATVLPDSTSAPPAVTACVVEAVQGLELAPADEREGRVALRFKLKPGSRKARHGADLEN